MQYTWCMTADGYVTNSKSGKLHRYIMKYYGNNYIDHINSNKLDNRKYNLRIVTPNENAQNKNINSKSSSKYIGVCWNKINNKWQASISVNSKKVHLGYFINKIEAAKARDIATKQYFGEFGKLNFI